MTDNIEQRSPEWFAARCGSLGASSIADVTAKTKTGWGSSRANVKAKMIAERLTGQAQESYTNAAMQWGIDTEAAARDAYCFYTDNDVTEMGLVRHPSIPNTHASPDGVIMMDGGVAGLVEIKCPLTATHIDTLKSQVVPDKYVKQMLWQMACIGGEWCDFVSFDPRMPADMQLFVKRLERDQARIDELAEQVVEFLGEVDADIAALTSIYRKG